MCDTPHILKTNNDPVKRFWVLFEREKKFEWSRLTVFSVLASFYFLNDKIDKFKISVSF